MEIQAIKVNDTKYLLTFQQNQYAKIAILENNSYFNIGTLCVNSESTDEEIKDAVLDMQKNQKNNDECLGQDYLDSQEEYEDEML